MKDPLATSPDVTIETADVVVLGAGPAGSLAAARLARAGRRVVCLERGFFPRHSIGESLLPRCNELLAEAGLWDAVVARGYMEKRGALFVRDGESERFCFADGLPGEPASTFQVPRDDFDQTLATAARALGADVRFGVDVASVDRASGADAATRRLRVRGSDVETRAPVAIDARFVLDASGAGRVLPRLFDLVRPAALPPRVAVYAMVEGDLRPEGALSGDIWVCIHPAGPWLWIIPFSNGRTSVGAVGDASMLPPGDDRAALFALVRSHGAAARRLAAARPVTRTTRLEAWSSSVSALSGPGWAIAGNAGEFLDPVFSSGVMLALESSSLAATLADRELAGDAVDWSRDYDARVRALVSVFRAFVDGWYRGDVERVFFARHKVESVFRYVTSILGGHAGRTENPLVRDPEGHLARLARAVSRAEP